MPAVLGTLSPADAQAQRLIELGAHEVAGLSATELRAAAGAPGTGDGLLALHPDYAHASLLAALLERDGKRGFVVVDTPGLDEFCPTESAALPSCGPTYVVRDVDRGDHLGNWTPDEALATVTAAGRTPLTVGEGVQWLVQRPDVVQRGHCFMTIGAACAKPMVRSTRGPRQSGSATAPVGMARKTEEHLKSVGVGPATGTRDWEFATAAGRGRVTSGAMP